MAKKKDENFVDLDIMPFATVNTNIDKPTTKFDNHKKNVWELKIEEFGLTKTIDPKEYFKTTGEAVRKARRLASDAFELAQAAQHMADVLEKVRGENDYLETRHQNHRLTVLAKNSRRKQKERKKAKEEAAKKNAKKTDSPGGS